MLSIDQLLLLSTKILSLLAGIAGIGFLIGFHELGHFLFCKLFNIHTPSFSIGFGPKLISKKIGDTEFSLSAIPLGGYVEIAGAVEPGQGEQEHAQSIDERSFIRKPYWQKMCVVAGGIVFNIIFAYAAFIGLYMTGIPANGLLTEGDTKPIIATIGEDSPASQAELKEGDIIISINNTGVTTIKELLSQIKSHPKKTVSVVISRDGKQITKQIRLGQKEFGSEKIGFLGVSFKNEPIKPQPFIIAIKKGIAATHTWTKRTIEGYAQLFAQRDTKNIAGPIAMIGLASQSASAGFKMLLILLAIISINLAVLNVIPLPILDGGQALIYTVEAAMGKQLPIKVREVIAIATWIMFLILFAYLSIKDIGNIAGPYLQKMFNFLGK